MTFFGTADGVASSDLGRRLTGRRRELGLSIPYVAAGASMDPGYLAYLESSTAPNPSATTLLRLAVVLRTSVAALQGGDQLAPPGRGPAVPDASLEELTRAECMALVAPGGVGRFVFLEARGPVALPVNFRMLGDDVVFRTADEGAVAERAEQRRVSFEVDHIDEARAEGWSVLLSGCARVVRDEAELAGLRVAAVEPWAGRDRETYVRLTPEEVSGRRIRALPVTGGVPRAK